MNLQEATTIACKILDEERISPTIRYSSSQPILNTSGPAFASYGIQWHPLKVQDPPGMVRFTSVNYGLLSGVLGELADPDKTAFVQFVLHRVSDRRAYRHTLHDVRGAGSWQNSTSELPLIAEFLVRQNQAAALLQALPHCPIRPGLTLLLRQIEEMIAWDFRLFSDSEYNTLSEIVQKLLPQIESLSRQGRISDTEESNVRFHLVRELPPLCNSISEMGRKAIFLRLKHSRLSDANIEIENDREQVKGFLQKLGFSRVLVAALEHAERSYREASNAFEYKECMSHLRSFLEGLHKEASARVHAKSGGVMPSTWGQSVAFLAKGSVLTKSEEEFVTSLYRLVSDMGVHPLIAEREYARLMRNMNIEYGLLFLKRLDKWLALP